MQPSLPIIFKSKASGDLVVPVLPHLRHFSFNFFELSLAPCFVLFCSDWLLLLFWFEISSLDQDVLVTPMRNVFVPFTFRHFKTTFVIKDYQL